MKTNDIADKIEAIFKNTKRIHGRSESLDWMKIASIKAARYVLLLHENKVCDNCGKSMDIINGGFRQCHNCGHKRAL